MRYFLRGILSAAFVVLAASSASAQLLSPPNWGFETGDKTNWSWNGSADVVTSYSTTTGPAYTYLAPEGSHFMRIAGTCRGNAAFIQSSNVVMAAGDRIGGSAAFDANDPTGQNDNARISATTARFGVPNVWYADVIEVGSFGHGVWEQWGFVASRADTYMFTFAVTNVGTFDPITSTCAPNNGISYGLFDAPGDPDQDNDGFVDSSDNCPAVSNSDQANNDLDTQGDACDDDDDNDGVLDGSDNCVFAANKRPTDNDNDGQGDICDGDDDSDGVADAADNCPFASNTDQQDTDADGEGDACDCDDDGDGVDDVLDNCPLTANDQADLDGDVIGDACDADIDGDGIGNLEDVCPLTSDDQADSDGDGAGDACDSDDDNDGVADDSDNCPLTANADQADNDSDGLGNACDDFDNSDADGDTSRTRPTTAPRFAKPTQADFDGDGDGDACDTDGDGDGVVDVGDGLPALGCKRAGRPEQRLLARAAVPVRGSARHDDGMAQPRPVRLVRRAGDQPLAERRPDHPGPEGRASVERRSIELRSPLS